MSNKDTGKLVSDADHVQLERLAAEVNWRVDNLVAETLPELFTQDGLLNTFGDPAIGHDAIRKWGQMMDSDRPLGNRRHVLSNYRFVETGADLAEGTFHVTAYVATGGDNDTLPFTMGICTDRYARTAAGWKVADRRFVPHVLRS
jgi:hypothetical protein